MVDKLRGGQSIEGRKVYVPRMCDGSTRLFAASFRGNGIDAHPTPEEDGRTRELGARHLTGDECYPQLVTLGTFLKIADEPGFDPSKTAFFMPTASGPCRFGQYATITRKVFDELGHSDVMILSPTCEDGYRDIGNDGAHVMYQAWWGIVAADLLRKILHRFRPYERVHGSTDRVYEESLTLMEEVFASGGLSGSAKFKAVEEGLKECRRRFLALDPDFSRPRLLIGVVGEIFCRLSTFSNEDVIRRIEAHGGEAWLADIAEWVYYTNHNERTELRRKGNGLTARMFKNWLNDKVQHHAEHKLAKIFSRELKGREEPESVDVVLDAAKPWLDPAAALGEMVLNIGKSIYLAGKGVDAIMDISPFSCMNGIVSEAIYPKLSGAIGNVPIRVFYFDGTGSNLDEEVEMFMELAANHRRSVRPPDR